MGNKNFEPILCKQQADSKQFYNLITNNRQTTNNIWTIGHIELISECGQISNWQGKNLKRSLCLDRCECEYLDHSSCNRASDFPVCSRDSLQPPDTDHSCHDTSHWRGEGCHPDNCHSSKYEEISE